MKKCIFTRGFGKETTVQSSPCTELHHAPSYIVKHSAVELLLTVQVSSSCHGFAEVRAERLYPSASASLTTSHVKDHFHLFHSPPHQNHYFSMRVLFWMFLPCFHCSGLQFLFSWSRVVCFVLFTRNNLRSLRLRLQLQQQSSCKLPINTLVLHNNTQEHATKTVF